VKIITDNVPRSKSQCRGGISVREFDQVSPLRGSVIARAIYKDGREEILFEDHNLVVNSARSNMKDIVAGENTATKIVTKMKFGDGGHNPLIPTEAIPPTVSDEDIFGAEVITKNVTHTFPDGPTGTKVMFSATIETGEGNGTGSQAITEAVLQCPDDTIYSHKTWGLITKTNAFAIQFDWTLIF